ncbi:MAG: hypothetical protein ACKVIH_01480 [Burkholderiales bacterium]
MTQARITLAAQDNTGPAFKSAQGNLARVQGAAVSAQSALALLGIGVSLAGFVAATKAAIDGLDALKDASDITGASVENLSALEDVARRNGQSLDTVTTSLVKFNQVLGGIKPGNDADQALKALGLRAAELKALDPAEALRQTAVALSAYADDANKARLVQELFGKSIREVGPYLKDLAEQGSLVAKVTTAQAEEAEKFNKQLFALQTSANDLARALAGPLVTGVNEAIRLFKEAVTAYGELEESLKRTTKLNQALYAQQIEFEAELSAAYVDESKSREQARLAVDDYVRGIDESNALVALELGLLGQTQQARDIAIQQYQIELALKKELSKINANLALDEAQREELRAKATAAAARASAAVVGRVTLDEWRKTTEQIESSLTDALLRAFESGKGFFSTLWDGIKNLFKTTVLRLLCSFWWQSLPAQTPIGCCCKSLAGRLALTPLGVPTAVELGLSFLLGGGAQRLFRAAIEGSAKRLEGKP